MFVCTKNVFRSPIAEYCLKNELSKMGASEAWKVESVGTWAKDGESALTVIAKNSDKLELPGIEQHKSRQLNIQLLETCDLIIAMTNNHKEAIASEFPVLKPNIYLLSEIAKNIKYDIPDWNFLNDNAISIAKEICMLIKIGYKKILLQADSRMIYKHYVLKK
jgi:protein-tyrosine-phosphatase